MTRRIVPMGDPADVAEHRHGLGLAPARPAGRIVGKWLDRLGIRGRSLVVLVPYVWLVLFFLIPFAIVLKISLSEAAVSIPPYAPIFDWAQETILTIRLRSEER